MPWHIYILKCKDGVLYTGITNNLKRRITVHNSGKGCKFTRCRVPVKLVYSEKSLNRSLASKREAQIKSLTRKKKLELIKAAKKKGEVYK